MYAGECGGVFDVPVLLQSPQYPHGYPPNLDSHPCVWTVQTSSGNSVACTFLDFDTEANYDMVTLCEGRYCYPDSVVHVMSGTLAATSYSSLGSSLTLQLATDGIISRRGFSVSCIAAEAPPPIVPDPPPVSTVPPILPTTAVDVTGKQ